MHALLAANVWHYWMSVAIIGLVLLVLAALFVGYLVKVTSNRFPRQ